MDKGRTALAEASAVLKIKMVAFILYVWVGLSRAGMRSLFASQIYADAIMRIMRSVFMHAPAVTCVCVCVFACVRVRVCVAGLVGFSAGGAGGV